MGHTSRRPADDIQEMTMTKQQADELASQLSETLALHFPQGPPIQEDDQIKRWLRELAEAVKATSSDSNSERSDDILNEIVRLAVEKWKRRDPDDTEVPTRSVATSFSLLDQLSAMPRRIFYNDIEAASSPGERLQLLQQVDHVDDVASDWTNVMELLFSGLKQGDYTNEYLELHRKWFEQCTSSAEHTSLQYGLCTNVVKAMRQHFGNCVHVAHTDGLAFDNSQEHAFVMIQLWHSMWMSAVKHVRPDDACEMAFLVMGLMRNLAYSMPARFVLLPAHLVALVDPYAHWFAQWIRHDVSPANAVTDLLSTGLLYDLMQRCRARGHIEWNQPPNGDPDSDTDVINIQKGEHIHIAQWERALFVHSLCMVRSILVSTRVGLFPWNELRNDMPAEVPHTSLMETQSPREDSYQPRVPSIHELWSVTDPFVEMMQVTSTDTKLASICIEAIETILWGLQDDTIFREFLWMLLDRLMGRLDLREQGIVCHAGEGIL